mmetsp:Transcript_19032/g.63750  ORF Transcript_19032/g.63750 Transcript_19032/m.63750 type:complete len:256 (+) Transcript_19032:385-1152(+)
MDAMGTPFLAARLFMRSTNASCMPPPPLWGPWAWSSSPAPAAAASGTAWSTRRSYSAASMDAAWPCARRSASVSTASASSYGGASVRMRMRFSRDLVEPPRTNMVKTTTCMVTATILGRRPSSPGTWHASATAMAPRRPDHHITTCSPYPMGSGRMRFTTRAMGNTLKARAMRMVPMVTRVKLRSMSSTYSTMARPTRRNTTVSATAASAASVCSTPNRAPGERLGAAYLRIVMPQKSEATMPDRWGTSAPTKER